MNIEDEAFINAAMIGDISTIDRIYEASIDFDVDSICRSTNALGYTILNKHYEVAKRLLELGADPNWTAPGCVSPLDIAIDHDDPQWVELMQSYGGHCIVYECKNGETIPQIIKQIKDYVEKHLDTLEVVQDSCGLVISKREKEGAEHE